MLLANVNPRTNIPTGDFATYSNKDTNIDDFVFNSFHHPVKNLIVGYINTRTATLPHVDFDNLKPQITTILAQLSDDVTLSVRRLGYGSGLISSQQWNKDPEHKALMVFLWAFPQFAYLITNVSLIAQVAIKSVEFLRGEQVDLDNFVHIKSRIDALNSQQWTRDKNPTERQSGVSNLGGISELLIEKALVDLLDDSTFFRTQNSKIQSYGDFVMMCLPNNLWLSVKSNFARERLLASGYTTDIVGVGFFQSSKEFLSLSKIRNFQRVGFLCMYLPEIPISTEQMETGNNTYSEVLEHYGGEDRLPKNINGTSFIRPLSRLSPDLRRLKEIEDPRDRTTVDF
ncbi:MAG: hypothetical protein ACE37D_09515 [Pseudomonadales bacterium]